MYRLSLVKSSLPDRMLFIFSIRRSFWKDNWLRTTEEFSVMYNLPSLKYLRMV